MAQTSKNRIWIILGAVILIGVVSVILFQLNRSIIVPASWGNGAGARTSTADFLNMVQQAFLTPIITAVMGIAILRRYHRHRIGWLLVMISLANAATMFFAELTVYGSFTVSEPLSGIRWAAWVTNWIWIVLYGLLLYMLAIFPNGRFPSRRWAILLTAMLTWFVVPLLMAAALEPVMSSSFQITNPLNPNFPLELYNLLFYIGLPAMPGTAVALLVSAVFRYRQGQGRERQQMKWLLAGVAAMALMIITGLALSLWANSALGEIIVNASILGPITGIGVALLRHQLYGIDIIIRRTLTYAMVSALLALVYFGTVVVLQALVTAVGGQQSGVVVAISTLVIAALFSPIRKRVQNLVDRRFYRQKYDAARTLAHFSSSVQDEVEIVLLQQALARAVTETLQPAYLSLWLKPEKGQK
jgi:hypothetical protein